MSRQSDSSQPPLGKLLSGIRSRWRISDNTNLKIPPSQYVPPPLEGTPLPGGDKERLQRIRDALEDLQAKLYAGKQYSVLLVFQALDAAGKDGAIKYVLRGLDSAGVRVASFKRPTDRELAHDFLWRTTLELPERGCITAFNRSYYEEVLAVRVHPEFLQAQYAGGNFDPENLWPERYRAIREHERHLATANTVVLKFWLNVSPQEQARRFLERIGEPQKSWKFSVHDVADSNFRAAYDEALMHMLNETSRPWAPWFCIPADDQWYARAEIADIFLQAMSALSLQYPRAQLPPAKETKALMAKLQRRAQEP